jgi:short-subunit dehydrogenase
MSDKKITALVTGASAGIGAEFCRQLASPCDVIIATGRREDSLRALAEELEGQVEVHVLVADLTRREGLTRIIESLRQQGPVDYLVNNAGFGALGLFADIELEPQQQMVSVHIDASLALCRAAIPFMRERGEGYIINVSSLSAFGPMAAVAVYGASKAFLNHFSEALQLEVGESGIKVQSLCPGYTRSEFHSRDSMAGFSTDSVPDEVWMEASEVVAISLAALAGDQVVVVPGERNHAVAVSGLQLQLSRLDAAGEN